jgi:intergrase/recombinase
MNKYIISLVAFCILITLSGCGKKNDSDNKSNLQILADKEKELNDREAKIRLKEIELEEREKKLNLLEQGKNPTDTSISQKLDTSKMTGKTNEKLTKKEIQKEISKKFENPENTVKDYYEYIQRAINETGNFDSNMKKAHEYYPSRSTDKMKAAYKNTKVFSVIDVPKVVSQKNDKAVVSSKVKQIEVVKKDGKDTEVTKTMTVTYNLTANKDGQWVITSNQVKVE